MQTALFQMEPGFENKKADGYKDCNFINRK